MRGEEVGLIHEFGREISAFTLTGDGYLYLSFSDAIGIYRLLEDGGLQEVGRIPGEEAFHSLEADASGRVWGWVALSPLLEITRDGNGEFRTTRHELVAGHDLREEDHEFSMTDLGPVLAFDGDLVTNEGKEAWSRTPLKGETGLPEAMTFRRSGVTLEGWLIFWNDRIAGNLMVEVVREPGKPTLVRRLPWVDMSQIGKIFTMMVSGESPARFLVGGLKGLMVIGESLPEEISPPSRPLIYDNTGLNRVPDNQVFGFGQDVLNFRFNSPHGGGGFQLLYQTRLSGRDSDWSEPSTLQVREFGRVMEGEYTLEVRAVDPFGRHSPVASVPFRIAPPWYRTYPAYAGFTSLVLLAGLGLIRFRERHLRGRQAVLEELVEERTNELKRANEFKDEFIANLSHEIRNPLNGVIGSIRQLKPDVALPGRYLDALKGAAHYLHTTVEAVLDFSKLESGTLEVDKAPFDIRKVVFGVAEIYRGQAGEKGLTLTSEILIPEGKGIDSDVRKIQQIIGNLVSNAVKFTQSGTVELQVSTRHDEAGGYTLSIVVSDSGPGVPESEQEKIFEKFYQGGSGPNRTAGTGLGLTLVKQYVECLDGWLTLQSTAASGTTFQIEFPVRLCDLPRQGDWDNSTFRMFDGMTVLVIEDLEYNRVFLEDLLAELGCRVHSAVDGDSGYELASSGSYRVIFLDWELPGLNGLEVAGKLRTEDRCPPETVIVGMTAFATAENRRQCLEAGMNAFLAKPIQKEDLISILEHAARETRYIRGRGLLGEMAESQDWQPLLSRWTGFHHDYRAELESSLQGGEPVKVRKAAHRLLGHLRMLDLDILPEAVMDLLTTAQAGDREGIETEWARLQPMLERFEDELGRLAGG